LPFDQISDSLVRGHRFFAAVFAHSLDVTAGIERGAGACDQQGAHPRVFAVLADHVAQGRYHL
jgi:hypothetical protein